MELMVVVAVMAVIASVAYPLYTNQVQKSRRADAKVALQNIALAQERFYTANNRYTASLSSLQVSTALQGGNSDKGYYTIAAPTVASGGQTFSVTASKTGTQAGDTDCASFTINQLGTKTATSSKCW